MSVTNHYKKPNNFAEYVKDIGGAQAPIWKALRKIERESVVGESLKASGKAVENFHEFLARTRRENLLAEVENLVNEYVDSVFIINELRDHFAKAHANSMQARQNIIALRTHVTSKKSRIVA